MEHFAFLVPRLALVRITARNQNVKDAVRVVAIFVVAHHVGQPHRAAVFAVLMNAPVAESHLVSLAFGAVAEVSHKFLNLSLNQLLNRVLPSSLGDQLSNRV